MGPMMKKMPKPKSPKKSTMKPHDHAAETAKELRAMNRGSGKRGMGGMGM